MEKKGRGMYRLISSGTRKDESAHRPGLFGSKTSSERNIHLMLPLFFIELPW